MKLSNQAIGAIMLALQNGILKQIDITETLQQFELLEAEEGLIVENPPHFAPPPETDTIEEQQ